MCLLENIEDEQSNQRLERKAGLREEEERVGRILQLSGETNRDEQMSSEHLGVNKPRLHCVVTCGDPVTT